MAAGWGAALDALWPRRSLRFAELKVVVVCGWRNQRPHATETQIYDVLRKKGVTGLALVAGDKHWFWAGLTSADLPSRDYHPVGVELVTGSK